MNPRTTETNAPRRAEVAARVDRALRAARVHDIHTHLFAPEFGELLLWGIDDLLTYHYLVAEFFRCAHDEISPTAFFAQPKAAQADLVWRTLFVDRAPISEAARGVITCLQALDLDPAELDLAAHRAAFASRSAADHVDTVLDRAGVDTVVMTNDPLDPIERAFWLGGADGRRPHHDPRFRTVLRIDGVLAWNATTAAAIRDLGHDVTDVADDERTIAGVQAFVRDWLGRLDPLYVAASVAPDFDHPHALLDRAIVPALAAAGIPLALMIGVRRQVNPSLQLAGDGLGTSDVAAVERVCAAHPDLRVLCTMLARENQHALVVAARKFANLHPFGCWWFVNTPSLFDEINRMRIELLGHAFTPQHSDARVLDQLLYKWADARAQLAPILTDKYAALETAGRRVDDDQLAREVAGWLGGNAMAFLARG